MQMAFFAVPARGDSGLQECLNVFLRSHRVLAVVNSNNNIGFRTVLPPVHQACRMVAC